MRAYEFIILVEAAYDSMIQSMLRKNDELVAQSALPDYREEILWAKKNLKRQDRVVWYLNLLKAYTADPQKAQDKQVWNKFQNNLLYYIGQQNIPKIQNYVFNRQSVEQVFADFSEFETEVKKPIVSGSPARLQNVDRQLIKFKDGTSWWLLGRGYCSDEARSGGHCGNIEGNRVPDQRIISYRSQDNSVILTFILKGFKSLGEMKGKHNTKPAEEYHPEILALLLNPLIKHISGGGYLPESNFSIFDFSDQHLRILDEQKPQLIIDQIKITPMELLSAPDWLKSKYRNMLDNYNYYHDGFEFDDGTEPYNFEVIKSLIDNNSIENWLDQIEEHPGLIVSAPDTIPNYREKLLNYLASIDFKLDPNLEAEGVENSNPLIKVRRKYRYNPEFITELIKRNPGYIQFINPESGLYKQIVPELIRSNIISLNTHDIPERLQTPEMWINTIHHFNSKYDEAEDETLSKIPDTIIMNEHFWDELIRTIPEYFSSLVNNLESNISEVKKIIQSVLKNDPTLVAKLVEKNPYNIEFIPKELLDYTVYENVLRSIVDNDYEVGEILKYFSDDIQEKIYDRQPELIQQIAEEDPEYLADIIKVKINPDDLQLIYNPDYDVSITALRKQPKVLKYIPEEIQEEIYEEEPELIKLALKEDGSQLAELAASLTTPELCYIAVKSDPSAIQDVPPRILKTHPEIAHKAVELDKNVVKLLPKSIRAELDL